MVAAGEKPNHDGPCLFFKLRFRLSCLDAPRDDLLGTASPLLDQAAAIEDSGNRGLRGREMCVRFRSPMVSSGGNRPVLMTSRRSS